MKKKCDMDRVELISMIEVLEKVIKDRDRLIESLTKQVSQLRRVQMDFVPEHERDDI